MTTPTDYDELFRENTRGLLFRDADNLSDWTTGVEWQWLCDGCLKGVWPEDATEVDDERFCEACVVEMNAEFEEAMAGPMSTPVATEEETLAMAKQGVMFSEMVNQYQEQIEQIPELFMFAPMLATGQAVDAWMLAVIFHPEWAQAHLVNLLSNDNARDTADRIVAAFPTEARS